MKQVLLGVKAPEKTCTDRKCPFHGELAVKPELFTGTVVKRDVNRSATIEWFDPKYVPKYERYEIRRRRMRVHNPACLDAPIGEKVLAAKTRPLSKTKDHVIIQKQGFVGVAVQTQALEEAKKMLHKKIKSEAVAAEEGDE